MIWELRESLSVSISIIDKNSNFKTNIYYFLSLSSCIRYGEKLAYLREECPKNITIIREMPRFI
jgi:hypothetical protein